jgi:hypothetical protein
MVRTTLHSLEDRRSTLEDACEEQVGRFLFVEPQYGFGWAHPSGGPFSDHRALTPLRLRVERVYLYTGARRGTLARGIETDGPPGIQGFLDCSNGGTHTQSGRTTSPRLSQRESEEVQLPCVVACS